jgi:ribonuclease BN (tRNA processing enzyme)
VTALAQGADLLLSEVTSVDEWKEQQIAIGRWQSMTAEQQTGSIRHMVEEHLTTEEIGKMATRANVKAVLLTHLPATTNPNDEYQRFGEQVKKHFARPVYVANDLKEF